MQEIERKKRKGGDRGSMKMRQTDSFGLSKSPVRQVK